MKRTVAALLLVAAACTSHATRVLPLQLTTVSEAVHPHAPVYSNTPIPCGSRTTDTEVFVTVDSTAYGPAPQTEFAVYLNGVVLWEARDEPASLTRAGTHEDNWYRQALAQPGRYTFEVAVFDEPSVPTVECDIYK